MPNRLASSSSPYLRQHADNPVDWFEWGEEAFAEARRRDVPLLISVGYAACHWCHVMAHESFEDAAIAAAMNAHFVCVKVDREERPDVDAVYMDALQGLTGAGGWPMTVFATPAGQPFWAGTYFPPTRRGQTPGFDEVCAALAELWATRREDVLTQSAQIAAALDRPRRPADPAPDQDDDVTLLVEAFAALERDFDPDHPGYGRAPKFPPSVLAEALLDHADQRERVRAVLRAMADGGIHDQLAGGFARYSVDRAWVVPHFEKMLYDNALLLGVYARAHALWPGEGFDAVARGIVGWVEAELMTDAGLVAASLDADSPTPAGPREGAFYVWTPAELRDALGPEDGDWAAAAFGVTAAGTFEDGASTLQRRALASDDPARFSLVRSRLLTRREQRPRPPRDGKAVTAWNAWYVGALVRAGMILGEPGWVDRAAEIAARLWAAHWRDGRLRRCSLGEVSRAGGVLEDYGALADAALLLHAATGEPAWRERAGALLDVVEAHFRAPDGGWFDTADDAEALFRRPREGSDNATWCGRSAVLAALDRRALLDPAAPAPEAGFDADLLTRAPRFAAGDLRRLIAAVATAAGGGPAEVTVSGPASSAAADELTRLAWGLAGGGAVVRREPGTSVSARVCRGGRCLAPVTSADALTAQLSA